MEQRVVMYKERIINQGEIGKEMYIIMIGSVKVLKKKIQMDDRKVDKKRRLSLL